jgi:putative peptidoglycan lipid II flippase
VAAGDDASVHAIFRQGAQTVLYLVTPTAVAFLLLGQPICAALFQRGEFGAEATIHTARALAFYAVGLPAMALIRVTAPLFYAHKDTRTPTWCGIASVVANLIGMNVLVGPFGYAGLALSVAVAAAIQVGALLYLAHRRFRTKAYLSLSLHFVVFSLVSLLCVAVAGWLLRSGALQWIPLGRVGPTTVAIAVAAALYIGITWIFGYRQLGGQLRQSR